MTSATRNSAAACLSFFVSVAGIAAETHPSRRAASAAPTELLAQADALRAQGDQDSQKLRPAARLYRTALDQLGRNADPALQARAWSGLGDVYFHLGQLKDSRHAMEQALEYARKTGDEQSIADALVELGVLQGETGAPPAAMETLTQALELQRKTGNSLGIARALSGLAYWVERHSRDPKKALQMLQEVFDRYQAAGETVFAAQTLSDMASAHSELGEVEKTLELYDRCLEVFRGANIPYWEAATLHNIGWARMGLGQTDAALEALLASRDRARSGDNKRQTADILRTLADLHALRGRLGAALEALEQALPLYVDSGDGYGEMTALLRLGQRRAVLGDWTGATARLQRALALSRAQAQEPVQVAVLHALAYIHEAQGRRAEARVMLEKALVLARAGSPESQANVLRSLGEIQRALGQPQAARTALMESLRLNQAARTLAGEAWTLDMLGRLELDGGHTRQAAAHWQRALELYRQAGDRVGEAEVLYRLARAEVRLGPSEEALARIHESLEIVESVRGTAHGSELRISYLATKQDVYELYVDTLVEQHRRAPAGGHAARALEASERARARGLLDSLAAAQVDALHGVAPELLAREAGTRETLNALEQHRMRLLREDKLDDAGRTGEEIAALVTRLQELHRQIWAASPRSAALQQTTPASLADIQGLVLDDETVLLEYALGAERSHLFVVTRDGLDVFPIADRATIEKAARRVHELVNARGHRRAFETLEKHRSRVATADRQLPAAAQALSQMVLPGAIRPLMRHRLLIVPHGALQYVPFAALPGPGATGTPSDSPIVARHEVVMAPSASFLAGLRRQTPRPGSPPVRLAVFADPVFEPDDPRVAPGQRNAKGPAARTRSVGLDLAHRAAEPFTPGGIPRLIHSRKEAEAILSLVPPPLRREALGFDATRAAATSPEVGRSHIIHFATHGFVHSAHPELSGLVLSLVDRKGQPQDGFLRLHDIYNLDLEADLVVLNACQTALGTELRGEGLNGLTRGFLHAGARRVLASLWNTSDSASASMITGFYRSLLDDRQPPAAALRAAQLATRSRLDAPYFWAPLVLQGEWR
jgi:CHAT domain-containing protein/Tfp pilus assembly protein PilF